MKAKMNKYAVAVAMFSLLAFIVMMVIGGAWNNRTCMYVGMGFLVLSFVIGAFEKRGSR